MGSITIERLASTAVLAAFDLGAWRFLRPARRELVAALVTAGAIGSADAVIEAVLGSLGTWRYALPLSIAGIPIDLVFDVALVVLAICWGLCGVERRCDKRRCAIGYVMLVTLVLGTWAVLKNTRASDAGMIAFPAQFAPGSAGFVAGNYVAVLGLVAATAATYHFARRRLLR